MIRFDFIVGNLCEGLYICFVFVGIFVDILLVLRIIFVYFDWVYYIFVMKIL